MNVASPFVSAGVRQSDPKTWAISIGISRYAKVPGGQQLQFADRDAIAFADSIEKTGVVRQNIQLLAGAEATVARIKAAIGDWLARSTNEADTVYIFFSGHGFFEREFGEAYIFGYDTDPDAPYSTALSLSDISHALARRVRARRVLIIADAARRDFFPDDTSGSDAAKSFVQAFDHLSASRPGISTILASGPGEFSREGRRWGEMGVFTKYLIDALEGNAPPGSDGRLTADEVFNFVFARVSEDTSKKQNPWHSQTTLATITMSRSSTPVRVLTAEAPPVVIAQADSPDNESQSAKSEPSRSSPAVPKSTQTKKEDASNPKKTELSRRTVPISPASRQPDVAKTGESKAAIPSNPKPAMPKSSAPVPPRSSRVEAPFEPVTVTPPDKSNASSDSLPLPPKPTPVLPEAVPVPSVSTSKRTEERTEMRLASEPGTAPSPLLLQFRAAIASGNLIEPKNTSAWDIYQQMSADQSAGATLQSLKPLLADALTTSGRAIVGGDVRGDNISSKIEDFRRAGQMFNRARTLMPKREEVIALERLSAAEALVALQFYDEAEKALSQLQSAKLAEIDNALGILYIGKLESWQAERAFKRAIQAAPEWAAPHYNLALLYRDQKNDEAISEFERAASLDPNNPAILTALGDEYFSREAWQKAADAYRKAISSKPGDDTLHTKLGHALYSMGQKDEANREYQKANALRNKQP